ncbi:MAG: DUF2332 domain-containing protein [Actinomycetota bacterium]|nr:DUF2332 domain-containing protein [Actinomycetota bacterium]
MDDSTGAFIAALRANAAQWQADGSPFYATLTRFIADDVGAGGPTWTVLSSHTNRPETELPVVRMLDAVHRIVLAGRAPALTPHYPSTGGDGDAVAAWPLFCAVVTRNADELRLALDHPPQTNAVGRCAAIVGGLLQLAAETRLPVRLLEIGASAGLLLRCDRYRYEAGHLGWGDPESPVRLLDCWVDRTPPLDAPLEIIERRGCDQHPLDPTNEDDRLDLLSYVWPDETARFELLRSALDLSARFPLVVERAQIPEWLAANVSPLPPGMVTVVMNSYVWQYLDDQDAAAARAALESAAALATTEAPLAHLSFEALDADYGNTQLRLTFWPGGNERLLALATPHLGPVRWLA